MWPPTDISYRKFARKRDRDGLEAALRSSGEFVTRKVVTPPILHRIFDSGLVSTLDRRSLVDQARSVYSVHDRSGLAASRDTMNDGSMESAVAEGTHDRRRAFDDRYEFVADLDGGYVLPDTGLGMDDDGTIIRETVEPPRKGNNYVIETLVWHAFHDGPRLPSAVLRGDTEFLDASATSLDIVCPLCPRFTNYYHWMKETVPKIRYAREYARETDLNVTYLVPSGMPSWLDETLSLLGVPDHRIEHASTSVYHADRLLVPSFPKLTLGNYDWIRERILSNATPNRETIGAGNNVYISRANAIERRVINEQEVVDMLSEFGFESYRLEEHSLAENAVLFSEADAVVGAHGAGLTDLIYCDDTLIVELFGSKIKDPYKELAEVIGVPYQSIHCQPESTDIRVETSRLNRSFKCVSSVN